MNTFDKIKIMETKEKLLAENWKQYLHSCTDGCEVSLAEYACTQADNDPGFFRWWFDDDTLNDFECKERGIWEDWVVRQLNYEEELTDDIEVARYNIPYEDAPDMVNYSIRYYDFHGICVFADWEHNDFYLGNIDEIGDFHALFPEFEDEEDDGGYWDIKNDRLAKLQAEVKKNYKDY